MRFLAVTMLIVTSTGALAQRIPRLKVLNAYCKHTFERVVSPSTQGCVGILGGGGTYHVMFDGNIDYKVNTMGRARELIGFYIDEKEIGLDEVTYKRVTSGPFREGLLSEYKLTKGDHVEYEELVSETVFTYSVKN